MVLQGCGCLNLVAVDHVFNEVSGVEANTKGRRHPRKIAEMETMFLVRLFWGRHEHIAEHAAPPAPEIFQSLCCADDAYGDDLVAIIRFVGSVEI